jgi:hypothetical protein
MATEIAFANASNTPISQKSEQVELEMDLREATYYHSVFALDQIAVRP